MRYIRRIRIPSNNYAFQASCFAEFLAVEEDAYGRYLYVLSDDIGRMATYIIETYLIHEPVRDEGQHFIGKTENGNFVFYRTVWDEPVIHVLEKETEAYVSECLVS